MRRRTWRIAVALATVIGVGACGGGGGSAFDNGADGGDAGGGGDDASFIDSGFGDDGGPTKPVASLTIDPPSAWWTR